jgi:TatA/E family protein of Tat protein translocase
MPFGNLGPTELILILAVALIVFGPKKLPEIGRGIGNALREFNKARNDFMSTINSEMEADDPPRSGTTTYPASLPEPVAADGRDGLPPENVDAMPYGGDFHSTDADAQPAFRTAAPEESYARPAEPVAYGDASEWSAGYEAGYEGGRTAVGPAETKS